MKLENIKIYGEVNIDPSSSINNIELGDGVKVAKRCSLYGASKNLLAIGQGTYIGMNTIINGYRERIIIGNNVSIAQNVNIMSDSGPNASEKMRQYFPIKVGKVTVGDDCWIGANSIIMPGVELGDCCVVAANSFVDKSFDSFSVIGGTPAKFIYRLKK